MSKLFIFGIGGTGERVLRSFTMLLAAGVSSFDQQEIYPIILDYDANHLRTIRQLCPELKMQLLCHFVKRSVIDTVEEIGNCGIDGMYNFQRDNALCREIRQKQIPLNMWTIDSEEALAKIKRLGASMATTNSLVPVHNQQEVVSN